MKLVIINLLPLLSITIIFYCLIRFIYIVTNKIKIDVYREIINLLFIIYILSLFYLTTYVSLNPPFATSNYKPFREILRYSFFSKLFLKEIIGNLLLFVPYGYFISYYLNLKKVYYSIFITLIISVCIELIQLYIGRVFDVDDILLNNIGSVLGYLIFRIITIEK